MKIELNTRTRSIKETKTKKEEMFFGKDLDNLIADELSILSLAIASKIKLLAQDEGQKNKLIDSVSVMVRAFLNGDE